MWEPGCPEPETSIKIAQRMALLMQQMDRFKEQRFIFIIHWARERCDSAGPRAVE